MELWLSGPVEGVHPLLTPAAHTFLQVRDEVAAFLEDLTTEQIWAQVGQSASIGYHAVHLAGATDRLLTYARGEALTDEQLAAARSGERAAAALAAEEIIGRVNFAMDQALAQLRATPVDALTAPRGVGRKLLPSTTLGLISHAAEHAYRHAGQMATLKRVLAT
jgi:uncharacterized damage-inducible protein DinB